MATPETPKFLYILWRLSQNSELKTSIWLVPTLYLLSYVSLASLYFISGITTLLVVKPDV